MSRIFIANSRASLVVIWFILCSIPSITLGNETSVQVKNLSEIETFAVAEVSAEVISRNRAVLAVEISGRIDKIFVDVGDQVSPGSPLVSIDDANYVLAVRQAKARSASVKEQIQQARIQLGRVQKLNAKNYASTDELLEATTQLAVLERSHEQALADLDLAKLQLSRTVLRAGVEGVVESRQAQLGEYAVPGAPMLTLTQTSDRQVAAELFPNMIESVRESSTHWFEVGGYKVPVKLQKISPVISPETRVQSIRFEFSNQVLPIGSIGTVKWREGRGRIPSTYLVMRDKQLGVFLLENNRAKFHVLPNAQAGRSARHDLPATAKIITEGRLKLQNDDNVVVEHE